MISACKDAYMQEGEQEACVLGCNQQAPFFANRFPQVCFKKFVSYMKF